MRQGYYSPEVVQQLGVLGDRVRVARVRRRWTQAELAERMGVERRTVGRLEDGEPGVGMGVFLMALWVMGLLDSSDGVADPSADKAGLFLERRREPKRVRKAREKDLDF